MLVFTRLLRVLRTAPSVLVADFVGETPAGRQVGVILHAREGRLSELEVYDFSEHDGAFPLPSIESLKPFPK